MLFRSVGSSHIAQGDQLSPPRGMGLGGGRETQEGGDMGIYVYIYITDSLCYKAEANTLL